MKLLKTQKDIVEAILSGKLLRAPNWEADEYAKVVGQEMQVFINWSDERKPGTFNYSCLNSNTGLVAYDRLPIKLSYLDRNVEFQLPENNTIFTTVPVEVENHLNTIMPACRTPGEITCLAKNSPIVHFFKPSLFVFPIDK